MANYKKENLIDVVSGRKVHERYEDIGLIHNDKKRLGYSKVHPLWTIWNESIKDIPNKDILWNDYNSFHDWAIEHGWFGNISNIKKLNYDLDFSPTNIQWFSKRRNPLIDKLDIVGIKRDEDGNEIDRIYINTNYECMDLGMNLGSIRCNILIDKINMQYYGYKWYNN